MAKKKEKTESMILGYGTAFGLPIGKVWGTGLKPIHCAALKGRYDCLRLCIERQGVDVNIKSGQNGWAPIHLCINDIEEELSIKCMKYLLRKGAEPNSVNNEDITPLHLAATWGQVEIMKLLVSVGADTHATDIRGHTPLDAAKLWNQPECAKFLIGNEWIANHFGPNNASADDESEGTRNERKGSITSATNNGDQSKNSARGQESAMNNKEDNTSEVGDSSKEKNLNEDKNENDQSSEDDINSSSKGTSKDNIHTSSKDSNDVISSSNNDTKQKLSGATSSKDNTKQKEKLDARDNSKTFKGSNKSDNSKTGKSANKNKNSRSNKTQKPKGAGFDDQYNPDFDHVETAIGTEDEKQKEYDVLLDQNGLRRAQLASSGDVPVRKTRSFLKFSKENVKDMIVGW